MNKTNYFAFATDEASQDAFLRWFLENWDDLRMGDVVKRFLIDIAKMPVQDKEIRSVSTSGQWKRIDVFATVEFASGEKGFLFIEDKVHSSLGMEVVKNQRTARTQLEVYNEKIDAVCNRLDASGDLIAKIYFKTGFANAWETKAVSNANWQFVDRDSIVGFFSRLKGGAYPPILENFAERIRSIGEFPHCSPVKWTIENWLAWIVPTLMPAIKSRFDHQVETDFFSYRGGYVSLLVWRRRKDKTTASVCIEFIFCKANRSDVIAAKLHPLDNPDNLFKTDTAWKSHDIAMLQGLLRSETVCPFKPCRRGASDSFGLLSPGIPKDRTPEQLACRILEIIGWFMNSFPA